MNRRLFLAEMLYGLLALTLDYEWQSAIAMAAALNYTAVAAIHALVLFLMPQNSVLDPDNIALFYILIVSVLFVHALQQWSQTLQKRAYVRTHVLLASWCILICVALIAMFKIDPVDWPFAEIDLRAQLPFLNDFNPGGLV